MRPTKKQFKAEYDKEYRKRPGYKLITRKKNLKRKYGITVKVYDTMLAEQNGKCTVCDATPGKRRLCVDHDHTTGKVRELLCNHCNAALGQVDDNIEILTNLIAYLKKHEV